MANKKRDSKGRFDSDGWISNARDNPLTSAVVAAGTAAAGAFLWSRRSQISDAFNSGMDRLSDMKSERMRSGRSQEEISEEALTLKQTGGKDKGPKGPIAQQDTRAGLVAH